MRKSMLYSALAAAVFATATAAEEDKNARWVSKDGQMRVVVHVGEEGDGTVGAKAVILKKHFWAGEEEDGNSGWLGVQIGTTAPSDDLTKPAGVVILNVVKDSPAEAAGFMANDVIIEVDDQPIGTELESFVDRIRGAGPGARVKFTVLRDGERRTLTGTLGSRAENRRFQWLFKSLPNTIMKDDVRTRLKMLVPGEDDEWVLEDMEDLADLPDLPRHILKFLPESKGKTVEVIVNDGGTTITTSVSHDGESISVERTGDGEITVTRSSGDEEEIVRYEDEEALEAGDPEAYKIYQDASGHVVINLKEGGLDYSFGNDIDTEDIESRLKEALGKIDFEFGGDVDVAELHDRLMKLHGLGGADAFVFRTGKTRRTIHENADGTIDVTTRKGDNELVQHYMDADDLAARSPEDYDAYLDLRSPEGTR